jgi:hypothetical protein
MEEYINDDTVIKNEVYQAFPEELIICQICQCLMIEPVMCLKCQNYYCKKCIDAWNKKSGTCPNKCDAPIFNNVIEKNRLITKLKYRCKKGCGAILSYDEIKEHYSSNCLDKKSNISVISPDQVSELRKQNKNIEYVSSK